MSWGDGAWSEDAWSELTVYDLTASGGGRLHGPKGQWSEGSWSEGGWSGRQTALLTVDSALDASGSGFTDGSATLSAIRDISASGHGKGTGSAELLKPWLIGGEIHFLPSDVSLSHDTISLTFETRSYPYSGYDEVDAANLEQAGDLQVEDGFGGSFRTLGSSQSAKELCPPGEDRPAFLREDVLINGYSESQVAPSHYEISLDLQRLNNRSEAAAELSQTGDWEFDLSYGTIGLDDRSVGQIDREGSPTGEQITIPLLLSSEQAGAIADAAGYPGGVTERSVPDGDDQLVDDSGRQSVTISTPGGSDLAGGEYLIRGWEIEWHSHDKSHRWQATLTVTET